MTPASLSRPIELIATFAHELCHPLLLSIPEPPPGGAECEEFATDLATTFFGFGLFGANSAFEFKQHSDIGAGSQGWSTRRLGYLTEAEWGFSLAIFLHNNEDNLQLAMNHLKPSLASYLKKSLKYFHANPQLLDGIAGFSKI